ncbi:MAG: UDP-N-acetylmuramate dehydrogenase, partial [Muribaculaceae bacterium]|nr:UDP-N-acetylmuramate dehydrogenase [Muribaculaceae bacterium]
VYELEKISRSPEFIENNVFHIGGGSNLLFMSDFNGLVLHSAIKGIKQYKKNEDEVFVISGAGEKWTDLVDWCVDAGLSGLENMAGIPGEVGAAPVQNVGAYGAEAKDVIYSVECFDTLTRKTVTLKNNECGFSYRDSNFKTIWKGRYFVLRVSFKLRPCQLADNFNYAALKKFRDSLDHAPTIREIAEEVVRLRDSKLPNPKEIGSAGSFYKNPIVSRYYYEQAMLALDPSIPAYPIEDDDNKNAVEASDIVDMEKSNPEWESEESNPERGSEPDSRKAAEIANQEKVKISAAWLIDHAGMKGVNIGGAQVYPGNSLVITNTGTATANDVARLSRIIVDRVREKYGIVLEREVNFIDTDVRVTILGSGTSKGVPEVGCLCPVCTSISPFDKRMRASALVTTMGQDFLIDVSPDFRQQALNENIYRIDAVLLTHSHYDHVGGIDDLRPFCAHKNVPIYLKQDVSDDLYKRIDYCFRKHPYPGVPTFDVNIIDDKPFKINGVEIIPVKVMHGSLPILGYRIGNFAYITDAKTIAEEELDKLQNLSVLVVNGLR